MQIYSDLLTKGGVLHNPPYISWNKGSLYKVAERGTALE